MKLGIVVPCYNEQEVLSETSNRLLAVLKELIHSNSINAEGNAIISIDADLQDDISITKGMVDQYLAGNDIVHGVRNSRDTDTFFKRWSGETCYGLMRLLGVELIFNHADYRLLSRRAIEMLAEFREVNLFLRGLVPQIGLRSEKVYYDRAERFAGTSKYPLKRMITFALEGAKSFAVTPLRFITAIGLTVSLLSRAMITSKVFLRTGNPRLGIDRNTCVPTGRHTDFLHWHTWRIPGKQFTRRQRPHRVILLKRHQSIKVQSKHIPTW